MCQLPAGTVVLLPTRLGACKIVRENVEDLKIEVEDWSDNDEEYELRGSTINGEMLETDIDICVAFVTKNSHSAKDLVRQARLRDLEVLVVEA